MEKKTLLEKFEEACFPLLFLFGIGMLGTLIFTIPIPFSSLAGILFHVFVFCFLFISMLYFLIETIKIFIVL